MGRAKRGHQSECSTSRSKVSCIEENRPKVVRPTQTIVGDVTASLDIVNGGQSLYQRRRRARASSAKYEDLGDMVNVCGDCGALFWSSESKEVRKNSPLVYTGCCREGRVYLPHSQPTPSYLEHLLDPNNGSRSLNFRKNIRAYNTMFAFTSFGADVDTTVNDGHGPYIFKISGQVYHLMGSLIPVDGERPKFAQLYMYDVENEVANRHQIADCLDVEVIEGLLQMLNEHNELVRCYRSLRNRYTDTELRSFNLCIIDNHRARDPQYDAPMSNEIAGLIVGDIGLNAPDRDIVVETNQNKFKRISRIHEKYMAFQYPLLFPYGEDGYTIDLQLLPAKNNKNHKRKKMSMLNYVSYYIHERVNEFSTILKCGRLFLQYIVDAYASVEEDRLFYIRCNQDKYRVETYEGICDSVTSGNNNGRNIGKRVILPSSHTGSPRYMVKHYHDAMTLCGRYGNPDLFITFTCNPKWPEITRALTGKYGSKPEDRPDIVARVFKMKLDCLMAYVRSGKPFGRVVADVATVEFQKRGLPHCHMLFWLDKHNKCYSAADVDSIISAEIPDRTSNPDLYDIVGQSMIHGPCGVLNSSSPCMKNGVCSKLFPKDFVPQTSFGPNKIPIYRRRDDNTRFVVKGDVRIDNRFVVPYNAELLLRYNAHINVESCSQSLLIKYLFKYINKGPDRARVGVQSDCNDEITSYLNCRYVSPCESAWRLLEFPIHARHPPVEVLTVHLPNQQSILFSQSQPLTSVVSNQGEADTMLTAWFKTNANVQLRAQANDLTYVEFPTKFVWDPTIKCWEPRKKGLMLGRLPNIQPTCGELYYLRLLLNIQKGCTSFASIRTVDGVTYRTYQDACRALGLLGDDKEWFEAFTTVIPTASSFQLRHLFVTMLLHCNVSNPVRMLDKFWLYMCDDILYNSGHRFDTRQSNIRQEVLWNTLLFQLEQLLNNASGSLKDYKLPMPDKEQLSELQNRQLQEELQYDRSALALEHSILVAKLNRDQKKIYDRVVKTVVEKKNEMFFVYGHGGTGKTFLWHTITSKLRSEGKIVLTVASSGIASLLLPNGRTAHSRFKIPLDVTDCSICSIAKGTQLAKLIQKTDLIIWDEAPMTNKYCFESLDKSLQDLIPRGSISEPALPFGGIPILLGGDFRQVLPVIPGGSKAEIVDVTLNNSYLWRLFRIFHLSINMRLFKEGISAEEKKQIVEFASWLLKIGDGELCAIDDPDDVDASWIEIPSDMLISDDGDPVASIFNSTFPNFSECYYKIDYIRERAVVTPKNVTVKEINDYAITLLPGETMTYMSVDSICESSDSAENFSVLYPPEFLNTLEFSGLPSHKLLLKKDMPVMLMRNLNQTYGLCNGTRLIITNLFSKVIEARVLTGSNINEKIYLPRVNLSGTDHRWPFKLKRRQFPIRPCYGMTINKSQGQSLKQVGIYLPEPVFSHGQLYVALSRVTSREGIKVVVSNESISNKYTKNIVYKDVLQKLH